MRPICDLIIKRGDAPARDRIRIARVVYVTDLVKQAKRELANADLRHAHGRLPPLKDTEQAAGTFEQYIDAGHFFCGDPDTVYESIKRFYDEVGGFGTLLLVTGKDWATRKLRTRSMERFMTEIMPRLAAL